MQRQLVPSCAAALLALALLGGCCSQPAINLDDYTHLREDPVQTVRYFQLAVELGRWQKAAAMLYAEGEEIGSWELWLASDMRVAEFGDLSLNEIIVGTYEMLLAAQDGATAVVSIFSHPRSGEIQRYDLALEKRDGVWIINLDDTVALNR